MGQFVESRSLLPLIAQVVQGERQRCLFMHQLQWGIDFALPKEVGAQDIVGFDRRLPCLLKTLGQQPVDIQAHLIDVATRVLIIKGME